jgi:hypothetical protein
MLLIQRRLHTSLTLGETDVTGAEPEGNSALRAASEFGFLLARVAAFKDFSSPSITNIRCTPCRISLKIRESEFLKVIKRVSNP